MYRKEGGRELEATPLIDRTETDGGDQEVSAQIDQKLKQRQRALLKMKNVKNTSFSLITYNKRWKVKKLVCPLFTQFTSCSVLSLIRVHKTKITTPYYLQQILVAICALWKYCFACFIIFPRKVVAAWICSTFGTVYHSGEKKQITVDKIWQICRVK